jgi:transcriptional regulator with XRE-family HTH domain
MAGSEQIPWEASPDGLAAARRQLGRRLRERRVGRGLSQEEVARVAGVSRPTYARFESGDAIIDFKALYLLAGFYKCKGSELLPPISYPSAPLDPVERLEFFTDRNRRIAEGRFVAGEQPGTFRRA